MIILGVDPGLNATGYGIIEMDGKHPRVLSAGAICPPRRQALARRLEFLHHELTTLIARYRPVIMVLEMLFTHHTYVNTAALMAHARGVACLAAQEHGLALAEYPPARIKKALTGNGNASKAQVARMVGQWLKADDPSLSADATDALALALAHTQMEARPRLTTRVMG